MDFHTGPRLPPGRQRLTYRHWAQAPEPGSSGGVGFGGSTGGGTFAGAGFDARGGGCLTGAGLGRSPGAAGAAVPEGAATAGAGRGGGGFGGAGLSAVAASADDVVAGAASFAGAGGFGTAGAVSADFAFAAGGGGGGGGVNASGGTDALPATGCSIVFCLPRLPMKSSVTRRSQAEAPMPTMRPRGSPSEAPTMIRMSSTTSPAGVLQNTVMCN